MILCLACAGVAHADLSLQTLPLSVGPSDMVWDATRSRFFASSGSSVVMINPETAQVEDTIPVGAMANRLAVSSDGAYLYAGIDASAAVWRFQIGSHALDLQIALGTDSQGRNLTAVALAAIPGQPHAFLVARNYLYSVVGEDAAVYDDAAPRSGILTLALRSLYVRASDNSIFGAGPDHLYSLAVTPSGVTAARSAAIDFSPNFTLSWNGNLVTDYQGRVFDLSAFAMIGQTALNPGYLYSLAAPLNGSVMVLQQNLTGTTNLTQYSVANFRPVASLLLTAVQANGIFQYPSPVWTWGTGGMVIDSTNGLLFFAASGLPPITLAAPAPVLDAAGVIHLPVRANGLVWDAGRNLVWASAAGNSGQVGNDVISIDPSSGNVLDTIYAGSEPYALAMSTDGSHLFTALAGAPAISMVDLNAKLAQPFSLVTNGPPDAPYWSAASLAALPNQSTSVIAVRIPNDTPFAESSVAVFDDGVPRAQTFDQLNPPYRNLTTAVFPGDTPDAFYAADLAMHYGDGTNDVFRLVVNTAGVELDQKLSPIEVGDALIYYSGSLFTGAGSIVSTDGKNLLGTFSSGLGPPILLPEKNQVVFFQNVYGAVTNTEAVYAVLFDLPTFRPLGSVQVTSCCIPISGYLPAAARAGSAAIAISTGAEIQIVPLTSFQAWPSYGGQLQTDAPGVQHISLPVNAIAAIPGSSNLAVATPSTAGSLGNSILIFNPATGSILSNTFIGSEPSALAVSADGSSVYAALAGEGRVARMNLASRARDLVFAPDPTGGSVHYDLYDMLALPGGGLATSYFGSEVAIFDNGVLRPQVDQDTQGAFAYTPATYELAANHAGTVLYAYNTYLSTQDLQRFGVSGQGLEWLSSIGSLIGGGYSPTEIREANGLLYTTGSTVVDPERSRVVGRFGPQAGEFHHLAPDIAAGRVYVMADEGLAVFDSNSYAFLGSMPLSFNNSPTPQATALVRFGGNGLAFPTNDGRLFVTSTSAIPLLAQPIPSPQSSLPSTPGVTVVDLALQDLAYDASRNVLYGSVPNSEAAMGDRIATIDPASGNVVTSYSAGAPGTNPRLLTLSGDDSQLYYTAGWLPNWVANGFSFAPETVRGVDVASGTMGTNFGALSSASDVSSSILDIAVPAGQPQSVAAIENSWQNYTFPDGTTALVNNGPDSIRIFDNGVQRPNIIGPAGSFDCTALQPGASASRLYCASNKNFSRVAADSSGVSILSSIPLAAGNGTFTSMLFSGGRIYTSTGLVLDAEAGTAVSSVQAQGPMAVDGNTVYWLDSSASDPSNPSVVLRPYDLATLQPQTSRRINVSATDANRLVPCGEGRLAFRAGQQVYIVYPAWAGQPPIINRVGPIYSSANAISAGSWISIYGSNLAAAAASWNGDFPSSLGGTQVFISNMPVYLSYVSPEQINLQVPDTVVDETTAAVQVTTANGSASVSVPIQEFSPSLCLFDKTYAAGVIPTPDGSGAYGGGTYDLLGPAGYFSFATRPAKPGEIIELYGVGFGPTSPPVPAGRLFQGAAPTVTPVTVTVGGKPTSVLFAGLSEAGVYQFNLVVPDVASGAQTVDISIAGFSAPESHIAVQ